MKSYNQLLNEGMLNNLTQQQKICASINLQGQSHQTRTIANESIANIGRCHIYDFRESHKEMSY